MSRGTPPERAETEPAGRPGRGALRVVLALLLALALIPVVAVLLLQNDGIATRVANAVAARVLPWPDARARIGRASLTGIGRLDLYDARVATGDGRPLLALDTLNLRLRPLGLLFRRLTVPGLRLAGARVTMRQQPDSTWDLLAPFGDRDSVPADRAGGGLRIRLDRVQVERAAIEAHFLASADSVLRIDGLTVGLRDVRLPHAPAFSLDTLGARITPPSRASPADLSARMRLADRRLVVDHLTLASDSSDVTAHGDLLLPGAPADEISDIDFRLAAQPLDFRDVGALLPGFDVPGSLRLDARVAGRASRLELSADGRSFDGASLHVEGTVTARTRGDVLYRLNGTLRDLDASLWTAGAADVNDIDADLAIDLAGPVLDSISGAVVVGIEGARIAGGTLLPTRVTVRFHEGDAEVTAEGGIDPWFDMDARGRAQPFLAVPAWDVVLNASQRRPLPDSGAIRLANGRVRLEASGRGMAARTAQCRASITLAADLGRAPLRAGTAGVEWSGGRAEARVALPLAQGTVRADGGARWDTDPLQYQVTRLEARAIDLALFADSLRGRLYLTGEGRGAGPHPAGLRANAAVRIEQAGWAALELDSTTAVLDLRAGRLQIDARAAGAAGTVAVHGAARPFDAAPLWSIERLELRDIDLARVREGLPASDLNALLALELRGAAAPALRGRGQLTLDSSHIAGRTLGPGRLQLALDSGRIITSGALALLGGRSALAASARPFLDVPAFRLDSVTFADVDVATLTADRLRTRIAGALELEGKLPRGSLPELSGGIRLDGTAVNRGRLEAARATFSLLDGLASVAATVRTAEGEASADATAQLLRSDGTESWTIDAANARALLRLPDLAALLGADSTDGGLDADVRLAGSGHRLDRMSWTASARASGSWAEARLDTLRLFARVSDGVLRLDTLAIVSNVAHGAGGGSLALTDDATAGADSLYLRLVADSAGAAGALVPLRPFALRFARLDVRARNVRGDIRVAGGLHATGLIAGGAAADSLEVGGRATLRDFRLAGVSAAGAGRLLSFGPLHVEQLNAEVTGDTAGFVFATDLRKQNGHTLALSGDADTRGRVARLHRLDFGFGVERWSLADTARVTWGDRISFRDLTLGHGGRRVALAGHLERRGVQDLTLTLDSVPLRDFTEFAGIEGMNGTLQGTLHLEGPAADVGLRTDVFAKLEGVTATVRTQPAAGRLAIDAGLTDAGGRPLRVNGTIPFALSLVPEDSARVTGTAAAFALNVTADAFSLDWLRPFVLPFGIDRIEARLHADLRLDGTIDHPGATGRIRLSDARITMPRQGIDYRGIGGSFEFAGNRVQIAELRAQAAGAVLASGGIILEPLDNPRFDVQLRFNDFLALRNEFIRLRLAGAITLAGDLAAPAVSGSLRAVDTDVFADRLGQEAEVRPVELTARDYAMLESYFGFRPRAATARPDPLRPWAIDVDLEIGSDVWVRKRVQPEMRIQLSGSLDVRKQPADSIQLFGTVEVLSERSHVEQFGKRFRIDEGTITFNGALTGWRTSIAARYAVPAFQDPGASEVVITLDVTGGMNDLRLTLGSEPAMETADVLSYLATGRPAASAADFGAAAGAGSLSQTGASFALGAVAGLLEEEAAQRIGLDVVEIRQDGLEGATLIAGRYVAPRLYVGFQQPLTLRREDEGIDRAAAGTEVEIEFAAWRWLLINLQGGQSEFRWFFRTRRAF